MKDLILCAAACDDFQRWLEQGHSPLAICQGEQAAATLVRLEKTPSVNYLYRIAMEHDNSISWNKDLMFCGVYDRKNQALYLAKDAVKSFMEGRHPFIAQVGISMVKEICGRINQCVEDIIANDQNNLPVRAVTGIRALNDLQYYQEYGAREEVVRCLFDGRVPDSQFHSSYTLDTLSEAAFLAYIQDPEGFVQTEAVKASGTKTVAVTVQKNGQELTFKTAASALADYRNFYSTFDIFASDRREFERLFGLHADYNAEDITRITYGRNTIYEPPPVQAEDMEKIKILRCRSEVCKCSKYQENSWTSCASSSRREAGLSSER